METLALLDHPADRQRLTEAEQSVDGGDVTSGEDMSRLMDQRVQRSTGAR